MPWPVAMTLVEYWTSCPPAHLMLREIGRQLGITVGQPSKADLSQAEQWAESGYIPGVGSIPTRTVDELPLTVREMIVNLKRGQHDA